MTWSIIARDRDTGQFGIAVATRFFAVGELVPHVKSRTGAIATQALVNPFYGTEGLHFLEQGVPVRDVVSALTAADIGRGHRQLHVMDAKGRTAAHTGKACIDWCGHLAGDAISVAGNRLVGASVVEDTAAAYAGNAALSFPRRLGNQRTRLPQQFTELLPPSNGLAGVVTVLQGRKENSSVNTIR